MLPTGCRCTRLAQCGVYGTPVQLSQLVVRLSCCEWNVRPECHVIFDFEIGKQVPRSVAQLSISLAFLRLTPMRLFQFCVQVAHLNFKLFQPLWLFTFHCCLPHRTDLTPELFASLAQSLKSVNSSKVYKSNHGIANRPICAQVCPCVYNVARLKFKR